MPHCDVYGPRSSFIDVEGDMHIRVEVVQLLVALVGAVAALSQLQRTMALRRFYVSSGGRNPEVLAQAIANIRDESFRFAKHLLLVVVGIVTVAGNEPLTPRAVTVRYILMIFSVLMCVQSVWVWRDWRDSVARAENRQRRDSDQVERRHTVERRKTHE
jgi:hypothetical protein